MTFTAAHVNAAAHVHAMTFTADAVLTSDSSGAEDGCHDAASSPVSALCTMPQLDVLLGEAEARPPNRMAPVLLDQAEERSFTCEVCRKSFKRETNLMFHMATHRQQDAGEQHSWNAPVQCSDCPKIFATKYQAKKHYLRRHFEGERRFACGRCNLKAFAVKEDLTTHMKTCGRTFACSCGARPRSLAALNKHCAQTGHTPAAAAVAAAAAAAAAMTCAGAWAHSDDLTASFLASLDASELLDVQMGSEGMLHEDILATLSVLVA